MSERIERRAWLAAPVDEVWDVITSDGWLADEVRFELRPGGEASFKTADQRRSGWVEEARLPAGEHGPARLTFWWAVDDEPASRVELRLDPDAEGTRIRVTETRPLDVLDLVGVSLPGAGGHTYGPALVAA